MNSIELLVSEVKQIADWRKAQGKRYALHHLLSITILGIIAGADDYVALSAYCRHKASFLIKHGLLDGKNYPSHDLFRQILQSLDPAAFAQLLATWLQHAVAEQPLAELTPEPASPAKKRIHVDGKSLRASRRGNQHIRSALQVVTAYCSDTELSVGQSIIAGKSCEQTAIPALLKMLDLRHCIVTIDAIATTPTNAQLIVQAQGDYVLALKKNHKTLYLEVESFFRTFADTSLIVDCFAREEQGHGRHEQRTCQIISELTYFPDAQGWKNLQSLIRVTARRTLNGKTSQEERYYLSSLAPRAKALAKVIRKHWSIENNLHWSLDVSFNEDRCRIRHQGAAANFAAIRRFALGLLKQAKLSKLGIKNQRLQAAWDDEFQERMFAFFETVYHKVTY